MTSVTMPPNAYFLTATRIVFFDFFLPVATVTVTRHEPRFRVRTARDCTRHTFAEFLATFSDTFDLFVTFNPATFANRVADIVRFAFRRVATFSTKRARIVGAEWV